MNLIRTSLFRRLGASLLVFLLGGSVLTACSSADPAVDNQTTAGETAAQPAQDPFNYMEEDLTPYVTLGDYKGLTVTRTAAVLTEEDFEAKIKELCEYYAEPEQITNRAAAEGDTVNFDFSVYIDGVQFDGGTAQGQTITLSGTGGYIEGFVTTIIGKKPGEAFDIHATFPEDYGEENLNGKAAVFKCTLNYIEGDNKIVPAFDDAFAQKISDFDTAEELRTDYRKELEEQLAAEAENQLYIDAWGQVLDNATILKYPEEKVDYIYQQNKTYYTSIGAAYYSKDYEAFLEQQGITDADVRADAQNYVKEDLIFYAIVKAENISVSDEEYAAGLKNYAAYYKMTEEELLENYGEASVRDGLLWDKVQEAIVGWANIVDAK